MSAVVTLRSPEAGNARRQNPMRVRFQQVGDQSSKMSIEVEADMLAEAGDLQRGYVLIHEGGDLRSQHLRSDPKLLHELPFAVKEIRMPRRGASQTMALVAQLSSPLELSAAYPGSEGIIGRRLELIGANGLIIGEGVLGWGA